MPLFYCEILRPEVQSSECVLTGVVFLSPQVDADVPFTSPLQ